MKRAALNSLVEWLDEPGRRPLVLRGARQVGKTWLVRELARATTYRLISVPAYLVWNLSAILRDDSELSRAPLD